jgi:hypothetical protein
MIINLPKLGPVRFDDNLTDAQFNAQLNALAKKYEFEIPKPEFGLGETFTRGVKRGTQQLGVLGGDVIPAMVGKAFGFEDYAKRQMEEAAKSQQEIFATRPPIYESYKQVESPYQALQFGTEVIGEQIPNIATALIPGLGGGVFAGRAALSTVGKSLATQAAERGLAGEAATAFIAEGMKRAAPQIAAKAQLGSDVGVFLGSYAQNAPEIFQNVFEKTGEMDVGTSLLFGAGAAALDSVLPAQLARQMTGPLKTGIVEKVLEKSGMDRSLLRSVTSGLIKGTAGEGLTEGAQEAISIAAENFVAKNPQVFESKEWDRIMEASVRGAIAGGGFGSAGGAMQRIRERYQDQIKEAAQEAQETKEPVPLQIGYDPKVGGSSVIYVHPDGSTSFVSELSDAAFKEKYPDVAFGPELTPAERKKEEQAAKNRAREEAKREAAEVKEAQDKLKKAIAELTATPKNLVDLAQAPSPLAQTIAQARQETEGLGAKLGPKPAAPAPAVPTAEVPTPEPTKVEKAVPSGIEGTIISADKTGLAALGKQLGIGRTAKILREDGPLAGKDLSDPAQAAEVKRILEAYASGKPAEGAAAKIEEFLKRPEFQVAPTEVPSEPTAQFDVGRAELSVPSDLATGESAVGDRGAGDITEPISGGLDEAGPATGVADVREEDVGRPLGVKETQDVLKAEAATEEALKEQADFVAQNDARANNILTGKMREAATAAGIDPKFMESEDLRGTPAHTYLRLPGLVNEYVRLKDVLAIPPTNAAERAQADRNRQEFDLITEAIVGSGPDMMQFLQAVDTMPAAQRGQLLSEINREAMTQFEPLVKERIANIKASEEKEARPAKRQLSDAELDQLADEFNDKLFERTGKKLFLPVHRGADLDDAGKQLVQDGNVNGLLDNLRNTTTSKPLRMILAKVKSLNLKTKIVVGAVENNQAGSFDPRTNTITIDPNLGMNEHTVLHELMHAAISHVLRNPNLPVTKQLTALFEQLQNQMGTAYGASDLQEFAAELVSNPEFQALLKTVKAPKSKNMFVRFMQTLAEFFGFSKGTNAYDKGLKLISDALDISTDVDPSVGDLLFLGTPNGANTGFGVVGRIGQAMPELGERTAEATRNYLSNVPGDAKSIAMGLLRLDNINTIYGKELPSLQKLINALELRNGTEEQRIKAINKDYKRFLDVERRYPQAMNRMNDMAYDARLEQVDLLDPKFKPSPAQQAEYRRLKNVYDALPADVQQVYKDVRNAYDSAINEYEDILINSVEDPSARRKLKAQYEARKRQIGYIPFLRRGDFWVEYDENGERAVQAFQSQRERQRFIETQLKGKPHKAYQNINKATFNQSTLPSSSFIVGLMNELNKQGASQTLKDNIYQSYLALFPAESLAKNFMKADNVRGMERDIVRGYGETMIKWARKLSASKYNPEIDRALSEIATQGEAASARPDGEGVYAAAQNIENQAEFFHNPTYNNFTSAATTISYFNYIAGNVSSALVNLTTLPMFSWSILGAKFGFDKSSGALLSASKTTIDYIFNNKVPPKYAKLFETLNDHAQLEHTLAREVLEGRRQTTSDYIGLKARVLDTLSIPFQKTEVLNRGATAIAAYDLARGSGMNEQDAIQYALRTVKEINTSGLSSTAPRYMQHPLGRVFFTFKSFVWNTAFVVARAFHQATKGESPAVRKEAFRQLVGIYGMAMAFAGIKGLPFMGATSTLVTMINALLGDDDEPYDFDTMMRNWTNELLYKGLVNYATNLEIANRVGVANDLIFRDDRRGVAEDGYVLTAMKQAFGPAGSFAMGVGNGAKLVSEGEVWRGIEAMVPSFVRNGMKAMRFGSEGALTLKGDPIVEDISAYNVAMQVIGFSPANLSNIYEETAIKKGFEREVMARRSKLLDKYEMAKVSGDSDLMDEVREEIASFNERRIDPKAKITRDTLDRSMRAREAAEKNMINGIRFNKNLMPEINALLDEDED